MRRNQGSMLCPRCGKLVSVSADRCPYCSATRPGLWGFGPVLQRVFGGFLNPVTAIPQVCIAWFVIALLLDPRSALSSSFGLLHILSPAPRALGLLGATSPASLHHGQWWTLLTAIYLHGGLLHILFNVMWIRNLAPEVGRAFGPARFFIIWTVAGALGFLLSNLSPGSPGSLGASGSIFGLMAALIVYGRAIGATLLTRQLWKWALILGVMGLLFPGIDNLAHLGGFAGGWVSATLFRSRLGRPEGRGTQFTALAMVAVTALALLFHLTLALGAITRIIR
ncbi:MAG: rhomboid family intramembrane serine protease [Gemmatimonadota bacterium]|nr:rhomboid family intramembrane serine protease [Gemmatimonadota bacterium]MDP7031222.1 rhomboid family intramembrane serine protease [Gemmatimonadota bacterium]